MAQDGFSTSCFQHFKKLEMKFEKWTLITRIFVVSFSIHETNLMTLLDCTVRVRYFVLNAVLKGRCVFRE